MELPIRDKTYVAYPCQHWDEIRPRDVCVTALDPRLVPMPGEFIRGDANKDLELDLSDPVWILNFLFLGGDPPPCIDAADVNDDGDVDISDATFLLDALFVFGEGIPEPYPELGSDLTADSMSC